MRWPRRREQVVQQDPYTHSNNNHTHHNNPIIMVGIVGNRMKEREPANNVSSCLQCVRHKTTVLVVGNGGRSARFLVRIVFALYLFLLAIGKLRITTTDPTMSTMERSLESFQRLRRQQQQQDQHLQHTNLVPSSSSSSSTSTTFGGRNANDEWIPRQDEVEPDYYDMDDGHDESSMGCSSVSSGLPRLVRERDYTRVPGYVRGCDISFYGYVMRDLAGRFLSTPNRRPSSSSNVLIVSSSSSISRRETTVQRWASNSTITKEEMIREIAFDIGGSFFIEATLAGYRVISVNNDDDDVVADHIDPAVATDRKLRTIDDDDNDETILLAVFDPDLAQQDDAVRRASRYIRLGSIEYAIFRMVSKATAGDDNNIVSYGLSACETFLSAGYRLQVFSSSHVSRGGHNDYGPNTMFKSVQHVENFLRHGARLAAEVQRDDDRRVGLDATFQSFLFATRGLELAIPSRKEFLNLTGFGDDDVIDVTGSEGVPYLKCPPSEASIRFNEESADDLEISCFGTKVPMLLHVGERKYDDAVVVWHSQPTIRSSEAACVRCKRTSGRNQSLDIDPTDHVACTTRVLEGEASPLAISHERHRRGKNIKPNLLLLELKGVNQHMLNLSLPALHNISESAGLVFFPNYVGMKKNHHVRSVSNFNMSHDLTEQGYRVFQASNQCTGQRTHYHGTDGDSTLSLHGSQLQRMFCFDYNRPNCLGNQHTASYIFQHTTQFIDARRQHDEPWAALLTLVDGQEETETVIGTVDASLLRSFVRRLRRSLRGATWLNTIVAVYSDDNLMPVLYLKASRYESTIRNNREMFVSALDLRRTLHYLTQSTIGAALEGELLTELLPPNRSTCDYLRKTIDATCDDADRELAYADVAQHSPPSILSFYADIPRTQKLNLGINRIKHMPERAEVTEGCLCSTNVRPWFPCDVHPWEEVSNFREYFILVDCPKRPTHLEIRLLPNEVLIKRSNQKRQDSGTTGLPKVNILFLEIDSASVEYADRHFPNTRELLKKYRIHPNGQGMYDCADGLCSADLSFMSLVGANSIPNQVAALSGCVSSSTRRLCGLDPTSSDSIGQVCNDPNEQHYGLRLERVRIAGEHAYWCPVRSVEELKTPWLFGVTDSKG